MLQGLAPHQLCGHLIKKDLYVNNNIFATEGVNQAEDFQVMPRLAYFATNVATLHEALYFYDRTTENSFSNNLDIEKSLQISRAEDIISEFFKDKSKIFQDSLEVNKARSLINRIKYFSLQGNDVNEHYNDLIITLKEIRHCVVRQLRFDYRLIALVKRKQYVGYITRFLNTSYKFYRILCSLRRFHYII